MPRNLLLLTMLLTASFLASPVHAQSVGVVYHGGIDSLELWGPGNDGMAELRGEYPFATELLIASDVKILPNGGALVAQASGKGIVVFSPEGEAVYALDPTRRYREVSSASVAGYLAAGQPSRVAIADSFGSIVTIRDLTTDQVIWFQNMALVAGFADIADVIVLPGDRVAIAANYMPIGIHTLDVFSFENGIIEETQFANFLHVEAPDGTVVVDALDGGIRSVFAGPQASSLLVATRFGLVDLAFDGQINWRLDIGERPEISGEVSDAKFLDNGLVVFTTFEPGAWVEASADHRVYWFDPTTQTVLFQTPPLSRAPVGIEVAGGHGATGTLGFATGLGDTLGLLSDLVVGQFGVGGSEFERGSLLMPFANLVNGGALTVELTELRIEATPGTCESPTGPTITLAEASGTIGLFPSSAFQLQEEVAIDPSYDLGPWCARLVAASGQEDLTELSAAIAFEIVESGTIDNMNVEVVDLAFEDLTEGEADMGTADMGNEPPPTDEGCGCVTVRQGGRIPALWLIALLGWVISRRRK